MNIKNEILTRLYEAKRITIEELLILSEKEIVYVDKFVPQPWVQPYTPYPLQQPFTYTISQTNLP